MRTGGPSQTALKAAQQRAVHQILEHGDVFRDPLAVRIVGKDIDRLVEEAKKDAYTRKVRMFIAVRSRFMEDSLSEAIKGGVKQLVILGAGLDTSGYRELTQGIRTFEVDHPSTQEWKRSLLTDVAIEMPPTTSYVPVDFENQSLINGLEESGFDCNQPSFFSWLGVVLYLDEQSIRSTLALAGNIPGGSHVVLDYSLPPSLLSPEEQERHRQRASAVAALGEPWVSYFDPDTMHRMLKDCGFTQFEDHGPSELLSRYLPDLNIAVGTSSGARILRATTSISRPV
jgi:methyltransferase (TIGR00027 family)